MGSFVNLPVFLCVMGLLSEALHAVTLEVEAGDNVTIWCQHELTHTAFIFWFKQTTDSVPLLLGCKRFRISAPSQNCYFYNETERMMVSVQGENASLTILALNVSDTGLYYCSSIETDQVIFRSSTYLHVREVNKSVAEKKETGCICSTEFFMLNVVFGSVIVILLGVLIFILLRHRKTHRAAEEPNEADDSNSVIYAALQFSKEKTTRTKGHNEIMEPDVVYASVMQSNVWT